MLSNQQSTRMTAYPGRALLVLVLLVLVSTVLAVSPAQAQQNAPAADSAEAAAPRPDAAQPPVSQPPCAGEGRNCPVLDLPAFLSRVLRSNPEVRSLRLEDDRAVARIQDARGQFDPHLVSGYEYKTQAGKDKLNVLRTGVTLPFNLPLSPSLLVDYRRGLGSSIDPSVGTTFDGETSIGLALEPLSGLFLDKKQATLSKARLEPRRVNALQAEERNRLLLDATKAYYKWVEAARKQQINQDLLDLATQRRDLITRRVRSGEAAAIDSTEAQLAVANRRERLAAAQQTAEKAEVKLAAFLWTTDGRPDAFAFAPPPSIDLPETDGLDRSAATETARSRRPELRRLAVKRQQTQIEERLATSQQRPNLKLKAQAVSYENGPMDVSDVKVGFEIEQPLFFRSSRSEAERARLETQQIRLKQDLTRRKIEADVDAALVDLRQARRRVEAARERVRLARRLQQAERRRFEIGESTLFLVNQREQSFAKARKSLVAARIDVARAYAQVQWATGTIADSLSPVGLSVN